MIVGFCGFINFRLLMSGVGPLKWIIILLLLAPMVLFGALALPLGREQPTEVWLLSRIRFMLQSRKRIWDQTGMTDLVTITVPKKIETMMTKNFTQDEVKSRLSALANTLDSRGWVVKNVNVNLTTPTHSYFEEDDADERLVAQSDLVQEVPEVNITAADDIMDVQNNPTAQNMQVMMQRAEQQRRALVDKTVQHAKQEFLGVAPKKDETNRDIHDLKPQPLVGFGPNARRAGQPDAKTRGVTGASQTDKLELANSGNDLSVASISKLVNRNEGGNGEVAIALH
jgi:hypothetical protein